MPTMTAHASGTFCWPELGTTDPKAAIKFYRELFEWSVHELPLPDGSAYSMLKKGSDDAGAMYPLMDDMVKQGVPPHWMSYVAVDSVDSTLEKVTANGGTVVMGPMDVKPDGKMLIGRMAVVKDPEGATFSLWQAGIHIGATVVGEPGALCWNELFTRQPDAALRFYSAVFGWGSTPMDMGGGSPYQMVTVNGQPAGGIMPMEPGMEFPPHWLVYFAVDDCDGRVEKAKAAGGVLLHGPQDVPNIGRFAVLQDPQGAVFAIIRLEPSA
jgi:predicted enzyme related to lactoylglutathione lyase